MDRRIISIMTLCLSLFVSLSYAAIPNQSGSYLFAGIGAAAARHHVADEHDNLGSGAPKLYDTIKLQQTNVFTNIGLGYGWQLKQTYYVAVEASYHYMFTDHPFGYGLDYVSTHSGKTDYTITSQQQLQTSLLMGKAVNKYLLYLRGGYALDFMRNKLAYSIVGLPQDKARGDINSIRHGVVLGLGIRLPVSHRVSFAAEYNYINYFTNKYRKILSEAGTHMHFYMQDKAYSNNVLLSLVVRV